MAVAEVNLCQQRLARLGQRQTGRDKQEFASESKQDQANQNIHDRHGARGNQPSDLISKKGFEDIGGQNSAQHSKKKQGKILSGGISKVYSGKAHGSNPEEQHHGCHAIDHKTLKHILIPPLFRNRPKGIELTTAFDEQMIQTKCDENDSTAIGQKHAYAGIHRPLCYSVIADNNVKYITQGNADSYQYALPKPGLQACLKNGEEHRTHQKGKYQSKLNAVPDDGDQG